jgi:hypothetical protein
MVGGIATTVGRTRATRGRAANRENREPLEETPSTVAYVTYVPGEDGFGFPDNPVNPFFDDGTLRFNTTELEIVTTGKHIFHSLPLPGGKPYILTHEGDGRYRQRGAVINFDVDEGNAYALAEGRYRATVREAVQLYEKGGYFDWSVSRVDLFSRPGMEYLGPSLIVIWDEDGDENDDPEYRTGSSTAVPETPNEALDDDTFSDLATAAEALLTADSPTPGGQ